MHNPHATTYIQIEQLTPQLRMHYNIKYRNILSSKEAAALTNYIPPAGYLPHLLLE